MLHALLYCLNRHIVTVSKQANGDPSATKAVTDLLSQFAELLTELDSLSMICNCLDANNTAVNKLSSKIGLLQLHIHWTTVSSSYRLIVGLGKCFVILVLAAALIVSTFTNLCNILKMQQVNNLANSE